MRETKTTWYIVTSLIILLSAVSTYGLEKDPFDLYCFMLKDERTFYDASNLLINISKGEIKAGTSGYTIYKDAFKESPPEFPIYIGLDVKALEEIWFLYPLIFRGENTAAVVRVDINDNGQLLEVIENYYGWSDSYYTLNDISPDGTYLYFSTEQPLNIYRFEHNEEGNYVNSEVWFKPFVNFVSRYNREDNSWERLTYDYDNFGALVSSDSLFVIYRRQKGYSKESVFCRSDGWFKVIFDVPLGLKSTNYFFPGKNAYISASPSLSRVVTKTESEYAYYFATPYFIKHSIADNGPSGKNRWMFVRFSVPDYIVKYDQETVEWHPGEGFGYEIKANIVELGLPISEFDYVLDVRFRSDGRYVSLVGVKDEVRRLYIYDLEEEELREVEGSEGALTARWLEIIE